MKLVLKNNENIKVSINGVFDTDFIDSNDAIKVVCCDNNDIMSNLAVGSTISGDDLGDDPLVTATVFDSSNPYYGCPVFNVIEKNLVKFEYVQSDGSIKVVAIYPSASGSHKMPLMYMHDGVYFDYNMNTVGVDTPKDVTPSVTVRSDQQYFGKHEATVIFTPNVYCQSPSDKITGIAFVLPTVTINEEDFEVSFIEQIKNVPIYGEFTAETSDATGSIGINGFYVKFPTELEGVIRVDKSRQDIIADHTYRYCILNNVMSFQDITPPQI